MTSANAEERDQPAATNPNFDIAGAFGVTVEDGDSASMIYVESQRDLAACAQKDYLHTIAHDIGHKTVDYSDDESTGDHFELGLMTGPPETPELQDTAGLRQFTATTLRRFREVKRW